MNKKNKPLAVIFLLVILFTLTGCWKKPITKEKNSDEHVFVQLKEGEGIVINPNEITSIATYYNYVIDGVTIQIFAVKASDGTIRVAYNTCGACNPAPDSYFIQKGEYFECQTCKNKFHIDEIGLEKKYGCSPIAILDENKIIDTNTITISSTYIEEYQEKFAAINIYEN